MYWLCRRACAEFLTINARGSEDTLRREVGKTVDPTAEYTELLLLESEGYSLPHGDRFNSTLLNLLGMRDADQKGLVDRCSPETRPLSAPLTAAMFRFKHQLWELPARGRLAT